MGSQMREKLVWSAKATKIFETKLQRNNVQRKGSEYLLQPFGDVQVMFQPPVNEYELSVKDAIQFLKSDLVFATPTGNHWECIYFDSANKRIAFQRVTSRGTTGKNVILLEPLTQTVFQYKSDWEVGIPKELVAEVT